MNIQVPWVEWIGYGASFFVAISFLMKSVANIRLINTIGCALFVIYAFIIGSYPVLITNSIIILINIWNLYKLSINKN